jgi:hypothetical protein
MAIAVPKRSSLQTAPAPSRTAPPEPKKRPRDRPRPGGQKTAPKRKAAPAKSSAATSPIRKTSPQRKKASPARAAVTAAPKRKAAVRASAATAAPARKAPSRSGLVTAPSRHKAQPRRRARVLPIAAGHAGRAAVAVTQLPESGLIHRLTRGRAWIGLLGILLVGIVGLNVATLSFAASSGKVEERNSILSKENSALLSRVATAYGAAKMRNEAKELRLSLPTETQAQMITARPTDVAEAASRLGAIAAAASASSGTE